MLHHQFKPQRCLLLLRQTSCKLCPSLPASTLDHWSSNLINRQDSHSGAEYWRSDSFSTMSCWKLSHAGSCGHSSSCQSDHEWHEAQAGTHFTDQTPEATRLIYRVQIKASSVVMELLMTVTFCSSQSEHWGQLNVRGTCYGFTPWGRKKQSRSRLWSPDTCRRGWPF